MNGANASRRHKLPSGAPGRTLSPLRNGGHTPGEGRPLADALETLERETQAAPMHVNPATASLYIANPLPRTDW